MADTSPPEAIALVKRSKHDGYLGAIEGRCFWTSLFLNTLSECGVKVFFGSELILGLLEKYTTSNSVPYSP
ncbi:MAG: hypothetical protein AB7U98_02975 [Candidatus Nitrosocosmicus sp.]